MKKVYDIKIEEVLSKIVSVEADSKEEALRMVEQQYRDSEIVLGSEDYKDTKICVSKD